MFEEPRDSLGDSSPTAEVCIAKQCVDLARPVHGGGYRPDLRATLRLTRLVMARAIRSNIKLGWPRCGDCLEDLSCGSRAIKY